MLNHQEIKSLDLKRIKWVHLIGITSPRNAFCAEKLIRMGKRVTASQHPYPGEEKIRESWENRGILYPGDHRAENIKKEIDLVVYPNGPIPGNPECEQTEKLKIPAITVGQLTGILSKEFRTIAIAGSHGKTTTTAMVVWLLEQTLGRPSFLIGDANDKILGINKNWEISDKNDFLVLEACEYKKQFLDRAPNPYIVVITNIEIDHTDFFKTQQDYNQAFVEFCLNSQFAVIIDGCGNNEQRVWGKLSSLKEKGAIIFDLNRTRKDLPPLKSSLPGKHNLANAEKAAAVGVLLKLPLEKIVEAMASFPGVSFRFEPVGSTQKGTPVYRDFAHNPAKIRACIEGAREIFPDKKVVLVFQPHNFERSFSFKEGFARAVGEADFVFVPNVYSARESEAEKGLISESGFVEFLKSKNPGKVIEHTNNFENTAEAIFALEKKESNLMVILASAGNLGEIIPMLKLNQ